MPAHRISHAVSRFIKAFQKKPKALDADTSADNNSSYGATTRKANVLAAESLALSTTTLPTAFFKQVKSLLERAEKQQQLADPSRFSSTSTRASLWSSSPANSPAVAEQRGSLKRQHKDTTRASMSAAGSDASVCYLRLANMLAPGSTDAASSSMRSVAVTTAVETLLQLWDFLLQLLQSDEPVEASTKAAVLALLQAIAQRREFDVVLHSLASGACSTHRLANDAAATRTRRVSSVRLERAGSFRVAPVMSAMPPAAPSSKKSSRRSFLKKAKYQSAASATPLCLLARRYLSLHQTSLQLAEDAVVAAAKTGSNALGATKQMHELLAALLTVSFVRVPFLREKMLEKLQRVMAASPSKRRVALPAQLEDARERALPLFSWHLSALSKCSASLAPFNRDEFWYSSIPFAETVLSDSGSRLMLCGNLVQHLSMTVSAGGRVEWQRVPGFAVLAQLVLWSTESLLQQQMRALETELPADDSVVERASMKSAHAGFATPQTPSPSSPSAFFLMQSLKLLDAVPSLIHPMLLTIFTSTNYLLPHHVNVCFQHLERIITAFPAYFRDEPLADSDAGASVDIALLTHVFTCLLESEHFEILKTTQLFLLKHFGGFSHTLRAALTRVFAAQFRRLFLHWSRDVRYCFFHVLLYLTYAGNRIVLCARSDECVLGAEAAQLFEIPGLVRTPAMAAWDVFDTPLHALLTRYNRMTKQLKNKSTGATAAAAPRSSMMRSPVVTPPSSVTATVADAASWVAEVPFTVLARSVPEYRRQVQTYFQCAKQFSLHEAVPVPVFYVKGSAPHS